jgi:hypothetical protein
MIRFACPSCELAMKCADEHEARVGKCPRCQCKFQAPCRCREVARRGFALRAAGQDL